MSRIALEKSLATVFKYFRKHLSVRTSSPVPLPRLPPGARAGSQHSPCFYGSSSTLSPLLLRMLQSLRSANQIKGPVKPLSMIIVSDLPTLLLRVLHLGTSQSNWKQHRKHCLCLLVQMCQTNQESYDMHAPDSAHWTAKKNRETGVNTEPIGCMLVSSMYLIIAIKNWFYGFDNEDFWTSPKTYVKFFEQSCQCSQRN
jgi:hypothetical protein